MAKILPTVDPVDFQRAIHEGARLIAEGDVVAFPTETVYGLGADATRSDAVRKIFLAKGRPATNPVIVHVNQWSDAKPLVAEWNSWAEALSRRYPQGPLTMVLRSAGLIAPEVLAGGDTVGIRVPMHPVARALIGAAARPIAAPSANISNQLSPTTAAAVLESLGDRIPLIIDGGPCAVGLESTVIDLTGEAPAILRPGMITAEHLEKVLGSAVHAHRASSTTGPKRSPGMLSLHYAPRTPLQVVDQLPPRSAGFLIGFADRCGPEHVDILLPNDPYETATILYASLRLADGARRGRIFLQTPPSAPGWEAVHDRVRRAAGMGKH